MRKVLIYFQDDRPRHRQQKGRPPCGLPRTTPTIRKGQRDHLHRVRRGLRGPSRSYVVAKVQVRLAFSHQALPAFPFFSLIISRLPFQAPLSFASLLHSTSTIPAFAALTRFLKYDLSNIMRYSAPCTPCTQAENRENRKSYCTPRDKPSVERRTEFINVENKRGKVIVILIIYMRVKGPRENCSYDREIYLCP